MGGPEGSGGTAAPHQAAAAGGTASDDPAETADVIGAVASIAASFVWRSLGEEGFAALLGRVGSDVLLAILDDPDRKIPYRVAREIALEAADICDDPDIGWRIGEEFARILDERGITTPLEDIALDAALGFVVSGIDDAIDVRTVSVLSGTKGDAIVESIAMDHARDRLPCRIIGGMLTTIPFFLGAVGTAVETRCVSNGAPTCRFRVRWRPPYLARDAKPGAAGWVRHIEHLHQWALELVEAGDLTSTLERVVLGLALPGHAIGLQATVPLTDGSTRSFSRGTLHSDARTGNAPVRTLRAPIDLDGDVQGEVEVAFARRDQIPGNDEQFVENCGRLIASAVKATLVFHDLRDRAALDPLTGLANREELARQAAELTSPRQIEAPAFGIVFVDLDGFKGVNDRLGHAAGDELLRQVATRLAGSVRGTDVVARYGGDEFVVLLADAPTPDAAHAVARKLAAAFDEPFRLGEDHVELRASLGVARAPEDGKDLTELLVRADRRMYAAKASPRA